MKIKMARLITSIFIPCLIAWNSLKEWFHYMINTCKSVYHYLTMYNSKHEWFLFSSNEFPLPIPAIAINDHSNATWHYDAYQNILTYLNDPVTTICKFSWLSAKMVILEKDTRKDYDMDDFLHQLRIHTTDTVCPQLNDLFILWCIHSKQWFSPLAMFHCHIIDYMGEERTLVIGPFDKLVLREKKVYDQICPIRLQNHKN